MLVATEQFVSLARTLASVAGHPDLRILVVPHPFSTLTDAEAAAEADRRIDELVGGLLGRRA